MRLPDEGTIDRERLDARTGWVTNWIDSAITMQAAWDYLMRCWHRSEPGRVGVVTLDGRLA